MRFDCRKAIAINPWLVLRFAGPLLLESEGRVFGIDSVGIGG
jgi:hypothetical protein